MIEAILNYDFMRYSFISGLIVGLIAPLLGTFIVVRRLSLIADALSHVALGGIACGVYLSSALNIVINPILSGIIFSVVGSLGIERLRTVYKHYSEIAIPIIMSLGIALSVLFLSLANGFNQDLFGYLFGSISSVSFSDLLLISVIGVIVLLCVYLLYKEMFLISFDEEYAGVMKINKCIHVVSISLVALVVIVFLFVYLIYKVMFLISFDEEYAGVMKINKYIHVVFIILVALVISASMRIVGILLVSAMMTLPVASAMRITTSFKQLMFVS